MPRALIEGASIHYEVLGTHGPWMTLSPGGRKPFDDQNTIAAAVAAAGFRVLLHDRRNCGASDLVLTGEKPEYEIWADDLVALLAHLGTGPAWVAGASSGARLALTAALRYPHAVRGLLLYRTTGSEYSCKRLAEQYYGEYIRLARAGGMAAVAASEHFADVIRRHPAARAQLEATPVETFIRAFEHWSAFFLRAAHDPVIGASEAELRSIDKPALVIAGNDVVHPRAVSYRFKALVRDCELHDIMPPGADVTEIPFADWDARAGESARLFIDFMRRRGTT